MPKLKVAVTLEHRLLDELDALAESLAQLARARLAAECAKLDPAEERAFAEARPLRSGAQNPARAPGHDHPPK